MINEPTLFDELTTEPTPTPVVSLEEYRDAMRRAAASYHAERPPVAANRVFMGAQETSRKAAERALPKSGTKRHAIWELMRSRDGLTADEVNEITGISPNTINPTIRGLVLNGWLEDSNERRVTRSGNDAIVWRPIP